MLRRALYLENKDEDPCFVTCHGFCQSNESPTAIVEDADGLLKQVPLHKIKLHPSSIDIVKSKNNQIIKP